VLGLVHLVLIGIGHRSPSIQALDDLTDLVTAEEGDMACEGALEVMLSTWPSRNENTSAGLPTDAIVLRLSCLIRLYEQGAFGTGG
jgi:hypothetical protein